MIDKDNIHKYFFYKKAISSIVAVSILVIVAVVAAISFQGWFKTYSTNIFSDVEIKSDNSNMKMSSIETIVSDTLYFRNAQDESLVIKTIKIDDKICNISNLNIGPGVKEINLKNCTMNVSTGAKNIVIVTNNKIYEKIIIVDEMIPPCSEDGVIVAEGDNYTFYNSVDVPYGSTCLGMSRKCENKVLTGDDNYKYSTCVVNSLDCSLLNGEWVKVEGNVDLGTTDFCVMKYEAKDVSNIPTSQSALLPWSMTQVNAQLECESLGYHLITDKEWVTIARLAENNPTNWESGVIGSGAMYRGNVNLNDGVSCGNNTILDGDTTGVNCLIGSRNKRTLNISGDFIWDFSGNRWEYTNDTLPTTGTQNSGLGTGGGWFEWTFITDSQYNDLRSSNLTWNSNNGIGKILTDADAALGGGDVHAIMRGACFSNEESGGIYSMVLIFGPSTLNYGFRCAYS